MPDINKGTPFYRRYYSKLMLANTIIVCVATLLYSFIASQNAFAYERMNHLKIYDDTLSEIHISVQTKHDDFHNIMQTLYDDSPGFAALSHLIEGDESALTSLNVYDRLAVNNLLQTLCDKDRDIQAVVLYKHNTMSFYLYRPDAKVLRPFPDAQDFLPGFQSESLSRQQLGIQNLTRTGLYGSSGRGDAVHAFFIGGNLATQSVSMVGNPGKVLVAYHEIAIRRLLYNRTFNFGGRFIVSSMTGDLLFDSSGQYADEQGQPLHFDHVSEILKQPQELMVDGELHYVSAIADPKRNFVASYLVPKSEVDSNSNYYSRIIHLGALIFISVSLLVFLLSTRLSARRIGSLTTAMNEIGSNNLAYRIPTRQSADELTAIASRFNQMCDELEQTINESYVYQLRQKDAELYALQTSVNPHFLYNTLEAIRYNLEEEGNSQAAEMIVLLSRLYRIQIKGAPFISLREEFSLSKMYLELFAMRFNHQLYYQLDLPPKLARYALPKLTLQPVLENFLIYGVRPDTDAMIVVRTWLEKEDIFIQVEDNGRGIEPDKLAQIQRKLINREDTSTSGFGLSNVHERLRLVYGDAYGLRIENRAGGEGTRVTFKLKAVTTEDLDKIYRGQKAPEPDMMADDKKV